jgi:hypothetical protein
LISVEPEAPHRGATTASPAPSSGNRRSWRPLGALLVENGLLSDAALKEALAERRAHPNRRLGEILVERGHLSGEMLASALAEQHGLALETVTLAGEVDAVAVPVAPGQPNYQVFSMTYEPTQERRTILHQGPNLLDAADFACDYVDREQPVALEIQRRDGETCETSGPAGSVPKPRPRRARAWWRPSASIPPAGERAARSPER